MEREQDVYRRSALERYASLDESNELPGLVPTWERLALAAVGMMAAAGLLWGALGSVPVQVVGEGFLEAVEDGAANGGTPPFIGAGKVPASPGAGVVAVLSLPDAAVDGIRTGMPVRIVRAGAQHGAHTVLAGRVVDARSPDGTGAPGRVRVRVRSGIPAAGDQARSGPPAGRRIAVRGTITIRRERPAARLLRRLRAAGRS
jgi:hypothetical protein